MFRTFFYSFVQKSFGESCPPKSPIQCGCDPLIFTIDKSLTASTNNGVFEAKILSVSNPPELIDLYNAEINKNEKFWKWIYEISYDDIVLSNPEYVIRNCDIKNVCCKGCSLQVVEAWLAAYVKSVTGVLTEDYTKPVVDNANPQNPVVYEHLSTLKKEDGRNGAGGAIFTYRNEKGQSTQFNAGFNTVKTSGSCTEIGVGAGKVIKSINIDNNDQLIVDAVNEHTSYLSTGGGASLAGELILNQAQIYRSNKSTFIIPNNTCRAVSVLFVPNFNFENELEIGFQANFLNTIKISGGILNLGYVNTPYFVSALFGARAGVTQFSQAVGEIIPAGGTLTVELENAIDVISPTSNSRWQNSFVGYWALCVTV